MKEILVKEDKLKESAFLTYGEVVDFLSIYGREVRSIKDPHLSINKKGTFCEVSVENKFVSTEEALKELSKYTEGLSAEEYIERRNHIFTLELNDYGETEGLEALLVYQNQSIGFLTKEIK